jgi:hypothetical protein
MATIKFFTIAANSSKNIDLRTDFDAHTGAARIAVSGGLAGFSPPTKALTKAPRKRTVKK